MSGYAANATEIEGCAVQSWNDTAPTNPHALVSDQTVILVETVMSIILIPILYIIGAPANIISMVVFFKQGLNERINLCLFLLALVDLIFLTFLLIYRASSVDAPFTNSGLFGMFYVYMINANITGFYGFAYSSMFTSTVIAAERCVCVLFPLKAQRCIRTKVFAFALLLSTFGVGCLRFVVTAKYSTVCFYDERTGIKLWKHSVTDFFLQNRAMFNILDGIFYGVCIAVGCPLITCVTTVITAVKLHQIIQWRDRSSSAMSSKEIGVTKMLICLSIEFICLSVPHIILRMLPMFDPELATGGAYSNLFSVLVSLAELCSCTSSCVNFFVYYFAGSRYRETLHQLLHRTPSSLSSETQAVKRSTK